MRLSQQDLNQIISVFDGLIETSASLYLFGSRVHDHLKGGDIDLLLLCDSANLKDKLIEKKHEVLAGLKSKIGDQKLDLKISTPEGANQDPFLSTVIPTAILIKKW